MKTSFATLRLGCRGAMVAAVGIWLLVAGLDLARSEQIKVTGRVLDAGGRPVAGVAMAQFWDAAKGRMKPFDETTSDGEGRFSVSLEWNERPIALLAIDQEQRRGALHLVRTKPAGKPLELKLEPLVNLRGEFGCSQLGRAPEWSNIYISTLPDKLRLVQDYSDPPRFNIKLPPGSYEFWGYGSDEVKGMRQELTLTPEEPVHDLKVVDLKASPLGLMAGKVPPPWVVSEARGVPATVQLADYRGRWVLVEFWGYW